MDDNAMVRACAYVIDIFANATQEKMEAEEINNDTVADFFHCLGGATARFILKMGKTTGKPEVLDSFLEGFSSYVRFTKETQTWENNTSPNLFWFLNKLDNDVSNN